MKLGERPVICLGKYEAIFKQYIFINKICTNKGKCKLVIKYEGYGIMILAFQSWYFGFGYPLTVSYLHTIIEYHALQPKYVDTDASTTALVHTHKEPITIGRNPFFQEF